MEIVDDGGTNAGTTKETCSSSMDYCYNATADVTSLNKLKMAGCSTTRCFLSRNKCIQQIVSGTQIVFCCCNNGNLCNSKLTVRSRRFHTDGYSRISHSMRRRNSEQRISLDFLDDCLIDSTVPTVTDDYYSPVSLELTLSVLVLFF